jgi:hypothetical protein
MEIHKTSERMPTMADTVSNGVEHGMVWGWFERGWNQMMVYQLEQQPDSIPFWMPYNSLPLPPGMR